MVNKRRSPTDDTRFQDSQSCFWLVVWQNQLGSQNPNQTCWHQKPSRTFWQRKFLKKWLESRFVFVHIMVSRCILVAISKALYLRLESPLWLVPCRHEDRTRPRTMAHRRRKQDHWTWWCTVRAVRNLSSRCLRSMVNLVNDDERQGVGQAPGNSMLGDSKKLQVGLVFQSEWQDKVFHATRKLGQKCQAQPKKVMRTPQAQGNLLHPYQSSETWSSRTIDTWVRSLVLGEEVRNVCNQRNILNGRTHNKCI